MTDEIKLQRCSKCGCTKVQEQYFSINKKGQYMKTCIPCREKSKQYKKDNKEKTKQYYQDNKEKILEKVKTNSLGNKERKKVYDKEYNSINQDKIKVYRIQYYEENKEKIQQYCEENKDKIRQRHRQYCKDKRHHCEHDTQKAHCKVCSPYGHLRQTVAGHIRYALKSEKSKHTIEYLGCTIAEFRKHIESQFKPDMTWDNHGTWHIDHIVPIKFKADGQPPTMENVIERLHWTNTQPLWALENISKGNRFIG